MGTPRAMDNKSWGWGEGVNLRKGDEQACRKKKGTAGTSFTGRNPGGKCVCEQSRLRVEGYTQGVETQAGP